MSEKILVVDDSVTVRQMVGLTLRKAGFEVIEGADGEEGLQQLQRERVVLIITDLNMPIMDGIALVKAIRQLPTHRFTPILVLTSQTQESMKQEARAAGATGWIGKPFNPENLLKVIARVLPV
jgi:two-component system chemotaxis response regulator CheY